MEYSKRILYRKMFPQKQFGEMSFRISSINDFIWNQCWSSQVILLQDAENKIVYYCQKYWVSTYDKTYADKYFFLEYVVSGDIRKFECSFWTIMINPKKEIHTFFSPISIITMLQALLEIKLLSNEIFADKLSLWFSPVIILPKQF